MHLRVLPVYCRPARTYTGGNGRAPGRVFEGIHAFTQRSNKCKRFLQAILRCGAPLGARSVLWHPSRILAARFYVYVLLDLSNL